MIKKPNFALCALNPHAGEHGVIGTEEYEKILPAIEAVRKRGINITNPLPADTLFVKAVQNALRYFPKRLHAILGPEFAEELKTYGHIYMYR